MENRDISYSNPYVVVSEARRNAKELRHNRMSKLIDCDGKPDDITDDGIIEKLYPESWEDENE